MTKIDKLYFLWIQKIANIKDNFNIETYKKLVQVFCGIENLYEQSKDIEILKDKLKNNNIDKSIIKALNDDNIKNEILEVYNNLNEQKIKVITYEDKEYPQKLKESNKSCIPFCIFYTDYFDINNKNILLFFDDYFTKFARNITYYFAKIINEEKANVFSKYKNENINSLDIICEDILDKNFKLKNKNLIILPDKKYLYNFILYVLDAIIIIEARYEKEIVSLVNIFAENGKDIYVVPSNIFRKNSYLSNYLIKQGADIILNKRDLKFILNNIIC